jgi:hypothetical protein
MKNATYWMEYLERLAEGQEKGTIKPNQAVEMNNTAGKVISLAKASMDAYKAMEKTKGMSVIPALQYEQSKPAE